jgi:hypothetical protein
MPSEIERRWEEGVPHDPRAVDLAKHLARIDDANDCQFDFRFGGDGDNGEVLMYLLDVYFSEVDKNELPSIE